MTSIGCLVVSAVVLRVISNICSVTVGLPEHLLYFLWVDCLQSRLSLHVHTPKFP